MERIEILHGSEPPTVSFVVSEAILRDRLGGEQVLLGMLRHVRQYADVPGVTVQIMPLGRQTHAGLSGPFILLECPNTSVSPTRRRSEAAS
ncbi:Scr1 family TA system antitoxin-like transcriptional regulator [Streptomyces sp. SID3915]|uniref:Scr1 family TA system antitoxin-like transcriptional regulator n=1 Tax=Streptomyces sp. SID3915 TaxID=2690263 RepID=UPI0031FDA532